MFKYLASYFFVSVWEVRTFLARLGVDDLDDGRPIYRLASIPGVNKVQSGHPNIIINSIKYYYQQKTMEPNIKMFIKSYYQC